MKKLTHIPPIIAAFYLLPYLLYLPAGRRSQRRRSKKRPLPPAPSER